MGHKIWACALAFLTAAAICLTGCRKQEDSYPTLVVYLNASGQGLEDLQAVNAALDQLTVERLGVHVQLEMPANYTQALSHALSEGEQVDIAYCPLRQTVRQCWEAGMLCPLDELAKENGQGILQSLHTSDYAFSKLDGTLYAFPTNRDRYRVIGFEYNQEIAEQYGLDLSAVESVEDLTDVFAQLQQKAPEIVPTVVVPGFIQYANVDLLGDGYGVLTEQSGTTVVNLYETELFTQFVELVRQWYLQGYTMDYSREAGVVAYYLSSGEVFGCLTIGNLGFETQETKLCGHRIGFIPLSDAYRETGAQEQAWYVIPTTSADPEMAMRLLNFLYTDADAANLILYGIEGIHYVRSSEQEGVICATDDTASYTGPRGYSYCNQYIAYLWEGYDADIWEQTEFLNRTSPQSPAWGFQFDAKPVAEQVYRCEEVTQVYLQTLYAGTAEPAATLAAFQEALREAGIEEIIAEKQRQLDAFLSMERS